MDSFSSSDIENLLVMTYVKSGMVSAVDELCNVQPPPPSVDFKFM